MAQTTPPPLTDVSTRRALASLHRTEQRSSPTRSSSITGPADLTGHIDKAFRTSKRPHSLSAHPVLKGSTGSHSPIPQDESHSAGLPLNSPGISHTYKDRAAGPDVSLLPSPGLSAGIPHQPQSSSETHDGNSRSQGAEYDVASIRKPASVLPECKKATVPLPGEGRGTQGSEGTLMVRDNAVEDDRSAAEDENVMIFSRSPSVSYIGDTPLKARLHEDFPGEPSIGGRFMAQSA